MIICLTAGNYYFQGGPLVEGRLNSLVTVLNNAQDPRHVRPAGVLNCGANVELVGEPAPGTFTEALALSGTAAHVNYADGRFFNTTKSLTLVLTEVTAMGQFNGVVPSLTYQVHGTLEATVTDATGATEINLSASF